MSERTQRTILGVALFLFLSGHPNAHAQTNVFPTTGNVGIGTLSPANGLSIRGSSFSYMDFGLGGTSKAVIGTDSSGSFIVFDPAASKYRLAIDSTGNVGLFGDLVVR